MQDAYQAVQQANELAVAAVAPQHITLGLGIDVEGAAPLEERLIRRICRADEMEALAARPERSLGAWAKLVFSAKEAFTKACFPLTRVPLGFQDAQVELLPGANRFLVRLCNDAKPAIAGRRRLEGRFVFHGALLFAAVVVPGAPA